MSVIGALLQPVIGAVVLATFGMVILLIWNAGGVKGLGIAGLALVAVFAALRVVGVALQ